MTKQGKMLFGWGSGLLAFLATATVAFAGAAADRRVPISITAIDADELITTARREEENVLTVPLSISTLSAADIRDAQITSLDDVAALTPGFSVQNYFGQNLSVPTIRGVSQVDIFGQPNAPIYVDGIYVSSKSGINFSFLGVERIETLRGPQPAYFGYNSFSGAVNFVTQTPGDEFEVDAEVTLGTDDKRRVALSAQGPLISNILSGRISGLYDDFGGTYNNANPAVVQDIGGARYKTIGATLFFTPIDTFSAKLNLYYSQDDIDPPALGQIPANCEPELDDPNDPMSANPDRLLNYCGKIPSVEDDSLSTIPGETGEERDVFRVSLNADWDAGFGTFSSLTGWSTTDDEILASSNRGEVGTPIAYLTTTPGFIPGTSFISTFDAPFLQPSAGPSTLDDFSQELRFTSPKDNRLRYTVGAYYRTTTEDAPIVEGSGFWAPTTSLPGDLNFFDLGFPGSPVFPDFCPCIEFAPGVGISPEVGGFIFGGSFSDMIPGFDYMNKNETDLWAGFGSIAYDINDRTTFYIEGRYTDFEETRTTGNTSTPVAERVTKFDDDFFNWRASLEFHPDDVTTYYASIATGTKQGGLANFTPETVDPDPDCPGPDCVDDVQQQVTFNSEEITTYEIGYKRAYQDGRYIVDGSVYYSDWSDIVLPSIITEVDGKAIVPNGVEGNIGDGSITGAELSVTAAITEKLTASAGVAYADAEFDKGSIESFRAFPTFAPNGDMSGQDFPRNSDTQANISATYRTPFVGEWEFYTRGDLNYQSEWYVGLPNQAEVPARTRVNWRLGLQSENITWELWANNLFDDDSVDSAFRDVYLGNSVNGAQSFSTLFPWRLTVAHPERRTVGITMRANF